MSLMSRVLLFSAAATAAANEVACAAGPSSCEVKTLEEVEAEEDDDAALLDVRLLQTRAALKKPVLAEAGEKPKDAAEEGKLVSHDHNGHVCFLCNKPLSERSGGKTYMKQRQDCGGHSSETGPSADVMDKPIVEFSRLVTSVGAPSNGFCELNFAKSCADAIVNEDYLYWAKSLNLHHADMKATAKWDARYCQLNGFLAPELVALQSNFTGLRDKARDLCDTKYKKHGIEKLTLRDMTARASYDDPSGPSQEHAEVLAAWNCAMGDLGCDMALCAYSFCEKPGSELGLYGECPGWDPVKGMTI